MQNRQLGNGFGVVDIKILTKQPSESELSQYGPNEYILVNNVAGASLMYIDEQDGRHMHEITAIPGLAESISKLPLDNTEVLRCIQAYHLKVHGGNEFILYRNECYRGLINGFPKEKIPVIRRWLDNTDINKPDVTTILERHTLALILPDILVDIPVTRLRKILPTIMAKLPEDIIKLFVDPNTLAKLNRRFLNSLHKSLPGVMPKIKQAKDLASFLQDVVMPRIKMTVNLQTDIHAQMGDLLAYLIPAILDLMPDDHLEEASVIIAKQLAPKDFRAIADEGYFKVQIENFDDQVTLKNNRRTIAFFPTNSPSKALFKSKQWQLDQSHLHIEDNYQESEFKLYDSRQQQQQVKQGLIRDPNLMTVGELHTVYKRVSKRGNLKYMAIGFTVKIGTVNVDFERILIKVSMLDKLTDDQKLDLVINYQKIFMPTLQRALQNNEVLYHSFGSIKSSTWGFQAGLQFNIVPDVIEISQQQFDRFKQLFGEMAVLTEDKVLEPIDRKADHRQPRM